MGSPAVAERRSSSFALATSSSSAASSSSELQESAPIVYNNTQQKSRRNYQTAADKYFASHGKLPLPRTMHAVLSAQFTKENDDDQNDEGKENVDTGKNILVIGDVHGCLQELILLHKKAVEKNDNKNFECTVLVGDLCNKGPYSAAVVKYVRNEKRWLAVRGNHDDGALAAALRDRERCQKEKYRWVADLSDEDVEWLSELPYSLRIPAKLLGDSADTLVVHAGLVPGVPLEHQTVETFITLREVKRLSSGQYVPYSLKMHFELKDAEEVGDPEVWARCWRGPEKVIFGHDARRGFQRYDGDWAIGLDTGACYGKELTGIILPSKRIVSINSLKVYSAISKD